MKNRILLFLALAVGMTARAAVITSISNVTDFQQLAVSVNSGDDYTSTTVTLTTDLDLTGVDWMPIGTTAHPFGGIFDGRGHTINNLHVSVDGSSTGNVAGLFGQIGSGGRVKNLSIDNCYVLLSSLSSTGVSCFIGGIAGINGGTIIGCFNKRSQGENDLVYGNQDNATVGGIAGQNSGTIAHCYNLCGIYTGEYNSNFLGGIAGQNSGTIRNCFSGATIEKASADGVIGQICANSNGFVTGCFYLNGTTSDDPVVLPLADAASNATTLSGDNLRSPKNVLLNGRTLYADADWNTLCLPFSIPQGETGYFPIAGATVKALTSSSVSGSTLTLNFTDATSIEAGKPYLVRWSVAISGNLSNPVFTDVEVSATTTAVTTDCIHFVGSFSPVAFTTDRTKLYLGSNNTLYYPNANMTINSFRAWFQLAEDLEMGDPLQSRRFVLNFVDGQSAEAEVTGITSRTAAPQVEGWYDLSGRRLATKPIRRGLYIHCGRKVIIR